MMILLKVGNHLSAFFVSVDLSKNKALDLVLKGFSQAMCFQCNPIISHIDVYCYCFLSAESGGRNLIRAVEAYQVRGWVCSEVESDSCGGGEI